MSGNSTAIQTNAKGQSTSTFITSLWTNAAIFGVEIIAFSLLRMYFKAIYEPRTYIPKDESKRSPPLGRIWSWPFTVLRADFHAIKDQNGVDAYMFIRFLRMMVRIFAPIWIISWIILLPVDGVESGSNKTGLDRFTFGNIGTEKQGRYWAHLVCAWVFTIWICYVIRTEMRHFIDTRQLHLVDPAHSSSAQANTILVTGIPAKFLTVNALTHLFSHLPGGVRKIWLNRDLKELPDIYERRLNACGVLENAEVQLIAAAVKASQKGKAGEGEEKGSRDREDSGETRVSSASGVPLTRSPTVSSTHSDPERGSLTLAETLVPKSERPTRRLPLGFLPFSLPFLGKKVDSIEWARTEIEETTRLLERGRAVLRSEVGNEAGTVLGGFAGIYRTGRGALEKVKIPDRFEDVSEDEEEDGKKKGWRERHAARKEKRARRAEARARAEAEKKAQEDAQAQAEEHAKTKAKTGSLGEDLETYPALNSAFVLFNQQIAAHLAVQALTHHEPFNMSAKYIEVAPQDVLWGNLGLVPYETRIRRLISYAITAGLIIVWSIPVAFIGAVSNVSNLCETYSWLAWLCRLPQTVIGLIQGVLPAALLSLLMVLLPIVLRLLARFEGIPRRSGLELSLMTRYFIFQVIHSFLIVTLSSGLIVALPGLIENPTSIPALLASSLPQASNFFLTYVVLQGLTGTAMGFLQIISFLLYYVKLFLLGSTPRSVYKVKYTLNNVMWGTLFPATTLIAVICIAYMVISPIINGLAVATFFLFYEMYKYRFLYQLDQPADTDTGGLFFPRAIQHVFVGLYIQQICLCTLFFLARNSKSEASAFVQGILMVVLLVFTAFYHMSLNSSYNPLLRALPLSLADKSFGMPVHKTSSDTSVVRSPSDVASEAADAIRQRRKAEGKQPQRDSSDAETDGEGETTLPLGGGLYDPDADDGPTDFYHPASVEPLRPIWIPSDVLGLGLGQSEVHENIKNGIVASCEHAFMDAEGHVDIDGHPPEGEWRSGSDE